MIVAMAVAAAVLFGIGASLQRHGVLRVEQGEHLSLAGALRLFREPRWLAGGAAGIAGTALQLDALEHGSLLVITPLLATGLVIALGADTVITGARLNWRIWALSALVALAIAGVVASLGASTTGRPHDLPMVIGLVAAGGIGLGLWILPGRDQHPPWLMAAGAGISVAYAGAMAKGALSVPTGTPLARVVSHAVGSWELYLAGALALLATLLFQHAYHSGPLAASLPTSTVVQPVVGLLAGLLVFGERFGADPLRTTVASAALAVTVLALWALSRQMTGLSQATGSEAAPTVATDGLAQQSQRL